MLFNEMNLLSAALEFFAAIITAAMLIGCFLEKKFTGIIGKFLIGVLAAHTAMMLCDAPIWLLLDAPSPENVPIIKTLSFISDACACLIVSLYSYCLTAYISSHKKISYRFSHIISVFCGISMLLCLISAFNGMYIDYDENGKDVAGPLYLLSQFIILGLDALTIALAIRHYKILGWRDTCIWILFAAFPAIAIPFQLFWDVTPVYLATTLSLILVYSLIHVDNVRRSAEIEKRLVEQELALSESRNALVLSQIQPHFLYNALTSIYRLCDVKPEAAKKAVSDFSKYLRGNLDSIKQTHLISFADELKHVKAYLSLEKIRYDDKLDIVYDVESVEFLIPPLTVQPLVENAVNHGVSNLPDGGCVTLKTEEFPDHYEIRVCDNGVGFDPASIPNDGKSHVGISSVRSRLNIMCGGTLDIVSSPDNGTTATIRIPKELINEHHSC